MATGVGGSENIGGMRPNTIVRTRSDDLSATLKSRVADGPSPTPTTPDEVRWSAPLAAGACEAGRRSSSCAGSCGSEGADAGGVISVLRWSRCVA